jgi:hypothetical protein
MRLKPWFCLCGCSLILLACAAHHSLQPVGRDQWTGNLSVGGPFVAAFDTRIPIPYLTAGTAYGLDDRLNLCGNLHLFPLAYQMFGMDAGTAWFPMLQKGMKPTLSLQTRIMALGSLKAEVPERIKFFPILTPSAAWRLGRGLIYNGMDMTCQLTRPDYNADAPVCLLSPFLGYRWTLKPNLFLYTELKWQGANLPSEKLAADYWGIARHGALSTLISVERGF